VEFLRQRSYGSSAGALGVGNILVVDDEGTIRTLLKDILVREGHEVTVISGGKQAIDLMERRRFDLVVTDLKMPGSDGVEVLLAAKEVDPQLPVLVITGYPTVESMARLVRMGASDYITKPFNIDLIKVTVAKLLNRKRHGSTYWPCLN
jgi:DNA-binding NtrC family response regulator